MKPATSRVALILHAEACMQRRDLEGALRCYRDILDQVPGDPEVREQVTMIYLLTGRSFEALGLLRGMLAQEYPPSPTAQQWRANTLTLLGLAHQKLGNHHDALSAYRQAQELVPRPSLLPRMQRAEAVVRSAAGQQHQRLVMQARELLELNKFDELVQTLRALLELRPDHTPTLHELATLLYECNKPTEALPLALRAVALAPNCATFHNVLGLIHRALADHEQAIACFQRAVVLEPYAPRYWLNLGAAHKTLQHLDEAAAAYNKVLGLDPKHAGALNNLGNVFWTQGDLQSARQHFERALQLDPAYADARRNLALLEQRTPSDLHPTPRTTDV